MGTLVLEEAFLSFSPCETDASVSPYVQFLTRELSSMHFSFIIYLWPSCFQVLQFMTSKKGLSKRRQWSCNSEDSCLVDIINRTFGASIQMKNLWPPKIFNKSPHWMWCYMTIYNSRILEVEAEASEFWIFFICIISLVELHETLP